MATQTQAPGNSNTGLIILAFVIIAALAVAAVLYMGGGTKSSDKVTAVVEAPAAAADKATDAVKP